MTPTPPNPTRGWMLYDARCGMCSASARRTNKILGSLGFELVPMQTPWVVIRLGPDAARASREVALLTADGQLVYGVDAYLQVADHLWWARPIAYVARLSLVHALLRIAYRWIAAHRQRISKVCRLHPDLP